ncbi:hypothetical protein BKA70DRAFT_794372 [Coprinopsis sp. MPI-PUGE-AT-0042]|nr:hypothetical protein BKA70DRAFT_794372 [Coprinopsis sp. MPI-PUGE-AT-0042]
MATLDNRYTTVRASFTQQLSGVIKFISAMLPPAAQLYHQGLSQSQPGCDEWWETADWEPSQVVHPRARRELPSPPSSPPNLRSPNKDCWTRVAVVFSPRGSLYFATSRSRRPVCLPFHPGILAAHPPGSTYNQRRFLARPSHGTRAMWKREPGRGHEKRRGQSLRPEPRGWLRRPHQQPHGWLIQRQEVYSRRRRTTSSSHRKKRRIGTRHRCSCGWHLVRRVFLAEEISGTSTWATELEWI